MDLLIVVLFSDVSYSEPLNSDYTRALYLLSICISEKKYILKLGARRALKPKCSSGEESLEKTRDYKYKRKPL